MSSSTNSTKLSHKTLDFKVKYKTEVIVHIFRDADIGTSEDFAPSISLYYLTLS
jgi:hypothetical protein